MFEFLTILIAIGMVLALFIMVPLIPALLLPHFDFTV